MTITVAEMIRALEALPQDAEFVVTESGYYCYGEFANIMLPELYTPDTEEIVPTVMYRIGHSHQSY